MVESLEQQARRLRKFSSHDNSVRFENMLATTRRTPSRPANAAPVPTRSGTRLGATHASSFFSRKFSTSARHFAAPLIGERTAVQRRSVVLGGRTVPDTTAGAAHHTARIRLYRKELKGYISPTPTADYGLDPRLIRLKSVRNRQFMLRGPHAPAVARSLLTREQLLRRLERRASSAPTQYFQSLRKYVSALQRGVLKGTFYARRVAATPQTGSPRRLLPLAKINRLYNSKRRILHKAMIAARRDLVCGVSGQKSGKSTEPVNPLLLSRVLSMKKKFTRTNNRFMIAPRSVRLSAQARLVQARSAARLRLVTRPKKKAARLPKSKRKPVRMPRVKTAAILFAKTKTSFTQARLRLLQLSSRALPVYSSQPKHQQQRTALTFRTQRFIARAAQNTAADLRFRDWLRRRRQRQLENPDVDSRNRV